VTTPSRPGGEGYDQPYADFNSPLMRQLRCEAYGEDLGQHSWMTGAELREYIRRLALTPSSRILDLGCGPGGPIVFILRETGCAGTGVDLSEAAIEVARHQARSNHVDARLDLLVADMNGALPLPDGGFDVVLSIDVVVHAHDRGQLFREVRRLLAPGGRFQFTDAAVLMGSISNEELSARSAYGFTQLSAPGFNERLLADSGFRLIQAEDRTGELIGNAAGRLAARTAHREELERIEGCDYFDRQQRYLECVVALSRRGAVARLAYLAELP
jgi:SAM-dependent methyltransferase